MQIKNRKSSKWKKNQSKFLICRAWWAWSELWGTYWQSWFYPQRLRILHILTIYYISHIFGNIFGVYLIYIYYYITSFLVFSVGNDNVDFPPHCLWYWSWQYLSAFFAALFSLNVILYVEQSWTIDVPTSAFSSQPREGNSAKDNQKNITLWELAANQDNGKLSTLLWWYWLRDVISTISCLRIWGIVSTCCW